MQDRLPERSRARRSSRTGLFLTLIASGLVVILIAGLGSWESYRLRTQMQNDPKVARVWLAGVTYGPHHQLERGSSLQRWLNSHHISLLGDYELISGQYANDPGSIEIWLNYESYLAGHPDLECHRIQADGTAFVDDLGQPCHGFLDIHGKTVGVYLPGYDHAAHEIRCVLQWMPRRPAAPYPVSRPTVFTVKLPRAVRTLPTSAALPQLVTVSAKGVTVTASAARLGPFKRANNAVGQRDLTFRLKIDGGEIANDNVANDIDLAITDYTKAQRIRALSGVLTRPLRIFSSKTATSAAAQARRQLLSFVNPSYQTPLTVFDPYGISIVAPGQTVTPLITKETLESARKGQGMVWVVPVNNAGKGTDVIRLRFDVLPKSRSSHGTAIMAADLVPFDLCIPVQTGDEI